MKTNQTPELKVHPFEKAGLGKAPFYFIGMEEKTYCAGHGAPVQPAGTCDYCSTGIKYCYSIRSADGKVFIVGSECVKKQNQQSLVNATEFDKAVAAQKREVQRARRTVVVAREEARIDKAEQLYADPTVKAALSVKPHPRQAMNDYFADKTLADWADWMLTNAGHDGRLQVARVIEKASKK